MLSQYFQLYNVSYIMYQQFKGGKTHWSVDVAAQMISTMANLEGEETFEASFLGQAEEVVQERICDDELILIKGYEV